MSFVRKDFYIQPPKADADPREWSAWLEADRKEAIKDRREYNKTIRPTERPEVYQETTMRRINGVWRQSTAIGISGSPEDGVTLEPTVEATQERDYDRARFEVHGRGLSHVKSGNQKRKERRLRRRMRRGN